MMTNADQMFREYALRAIADDYENFDKILQDVVEWVAECGVAANREAVLRALEGLINDGEAQAYRLFAGPPGKAEAVIYSPDSLYELWFYVTPKGEQLVQQFQKKWADGPR